MSNYTWTFDAPTGVYKSHEMSSDMRDAAIAQTRFMQFVRPEAGYGRKKGEAITITRVSNITVPTSGQLSENQRIPEDDLVMSTVAITVAEWGRAVPYSSLSDDLSKFDINNAVQRNIRKQMELVMDSAAAAAFKSSSAKIKAVPTGVSAISFYTNGSAGTQALANLNMYHIEQVRDYMFSTLLIPPYEGSDYIALASTKACRGIKSDPAWEDWHKYTNNEAKFNAEIGRIENVRFIEINNTAALSGSKGSGGVLGEVVFFGEDAVVTAVAQDPELRMGIPGDFGRQKAVAWYGILNFGVVWDTANAGEARIVHLTSS